VRRRHTPLLPLFLGGGQEAALRPGTENVAAVHAFAVAVELAVREQPAFAARARAHVEKLWNGVQDSLPDARLLGPPLEDPQRLPNTLSILVAGSDGRTLVARLDLAGLEVSAGSACASGSLEPSHVLLAMGLAPERARAGVRISLGACTTRADVHDAVEILRITFSRRA
jgi:cysteine desulfurase